MVPLATPVDCAVTSKLAHCGLARSTRPCRLTIEPCGCDCVHARELALGIARNLAGEAGVVQLAGLRVEAQCQGGSLRVKLFRADGTVLPDEAELK